MAKLDLGREAAITNGELKIEVFQAVPANMRCYDCESDAKFKKEYKMWIVSDLKMAEEHDSVVWKCPSCKKTKIEKLPAGKGGIFWHQAKRMDMIFPNL